MRRDRQTDRQTPKFDILWHIYSRTPTHKLITAHRDCDCWRRGTKRSHLQQQQRTISRLLLVSGGRNLLLTIATSYETIVSILTLLVDESDKGSLFSAWPAFLRTRLSRSVVRSSNLLSVYTFGMERYGTELFVVHSRQQQNHQNVLSGPSNKESRTSHPSSVCRGTPGCEHRVQ